MVFFFHLFFLLPVLILFFSVIVIIVAHILDLFQLCLLEQLCLTRSVILCLSLEQALTIPSAGTQKGNVSYIEQKMISFFLESIRNLNIYFVFEIFLDYIFVQNREKKKKISFKSVNLILLFAVLCLAGFGNLPGDMVCNLDVFYSTVNSSSLLFF